jgi:hypothetical protein
MTSGEMLGPVPNRIYETSAGTIHAAFAPSVVVLTRCPPERTAALVFGERCARTGAAVSP